MCLSSVSLSSWCKSALWDLWARRAGLEGVLLCHREKLIKRCSKGWWEHPVLRGNHAEVWLLLYSFKTWASEKKPTLQNKQKNSLRESMMLGVFSGIFYFFLDFLWKAAKACPPNWQQAEVTKKKEKEERKGEKNWCRRVRAREVGTQAKKNELVRRCYENSRQVRRVWSKVYWCCVKKKSLRKTRTRQSISTRTTNKTHSKQCHEGSPSDTAR